MTDTSSKPTSSTAKTRQFKVIRKFGHPDGSGSCDVDTVVTLTAAEAKRLIKHNCLAPHIEDDEDEE